MQLPPNGGKKTCKNNRAQESTPLFQLESNIRWQNKFYRRTNTTARDGSQWPQVSCSFKFIQTSNLLHARGNATDKVTSDSKIKQSTYNAAATASDICLSFSIILGGLLHLTNYKEHSPRTHSSSARDWQRQPKHNSKAHSTVKAVSARDGSQWPQVPLDLGSCSFKFIQTSNLLHARGNATDKVTSDSKIKQSTYNAAATASDICLSFSIILGGLLHLTNYKEHFPLTHAPNISNCKHLTQCII